MAAMASSDEEEEEDEDTPTEAEEDEGDEDENEDVALSKGLEVCDLNYEGQGCVPPPTTRARVKAPKGFSEEDTENEEGPRVMY